MRLLVLAVPALALLLAACTKTYGPSAGSTVDVQAGDAVVVAAFDLIGGGPGLYELAESDSGDFRLAFHAFDPATETFLDPPRAFYIEQSCAGADAVGARVCGARAEHAAVAVPPGDYILTFIFKSHTGIFVPNLFGYGGTTRGGYSTLLAGAETERTGNISGSYAARPGASVAGNPAPRFRIDAGETLYVGFLIARGATWLRQPGSVGSAIDLGLVEMDIVAESHPDAARAALTKAGANPAKMVERLARSESQ